MWVFVVHLVEIFATVQTHYVAIMSDGVSCGVFVEAISLK